MWVIINYFIACPSELLRGSVKFTTVAPLFAHPQLIPARRLSSMHWLGGDVIGWLAAGRAADDNQWLTWILWPCQWLDKKSTQMTTTVTFGEDSAVVSRDLFYPLRGYYALVWLNDKSSYVNRKPRTVINQTKKAISSCLFCFPGCNWICPREDNKGFAGINIDGIRLFGFIFGLWFTVNGRSWTLINWRVNSIKNVCFNESTTILQLRLNRYRIATVAFQFRIKENRGKLSISIPT